MRVVRISLGLLALIAGIGQADEANLPEIPPYEIPTYDGKPLNFQEPVPAMRPAPKVNGDGIFQVIVNCYPVKSKFALDIELTGGARYSEDAITTFDNSGLSRYYVGIVAKMPLYSATELDRQREREYRRRTETADSIKALMKGLADRRRAQRELGLYSSLEARSQKRVAVGVVSVEEQVGYLEKVAQSQARMDDAQASIEGSRLGLVAQCRDGVADQVNDYLTRITQ